jgi:hypothetical protein
MVYIQQTCFIAQPFFVIFKKYGYCRYPFSDAFTKLRKLNMGFVVSVCPSVRPSAWNNPGDMEFDICLFFENMLRKFKFHQNMTITRNNGYF